jgi:hypothetical protein
MPRHHYQRELFRNVYKGRHELRQAYEKWLASLDVDLFITLSLSDNVGLDQARQKLKRWLAYVDSHYLGRGWAKRPSSDRTDGIIIPESIDTNLHYHGLIRLPPRGQTQGLDVIEPRLEGLWQKIEWRGTCKVDWIRDAGSARYVTKQLVRPGYLDHLIFPREFHPHQD